MGLRAPGLPGRMEWPLAQPLRGSEASSVPGCRAPSISHAWARYAAWLLGWRLRSRDVEFNQQVEGECTSEQRDGIRRCTEPDTYVMWT